jgi:ATP-binding cassette subfamily B (MDR/TAP) protein 1
MPFLLLGGVCNFGILILRQGYNTRVGDSGMRLSGGQRQRLAIARSIVKRPSILILDEATSAIDVHSEKIVQAALDKVSKGRTTIMIAHRLSTVMKADNIVVLKKGNVVQQGTHDALLTDADGPYWSLANAQQLVTDNSFSESLVLRNPGKVGVESTIPENDFAEIEVSSSSSKPGSKRVKNEFLSSFTLFLWEQKPEWRWYSLILLGALGAGGECFRLTRSSR